MEFTEVSVRGVPRTVPCIQLGGRSIIASSKWPRVAEVKDEEWAEGEILPTLNESLELLRRDKRLKADIFTFAQKVIDPMPRFAFPYHWDSMAVVPVVSFSDWWTHRVSKNVRNDVKRAEKRGVVVQSVPFSDELVEGIVEIYNETPIRQGRPFWHYRKSLKAVREMNATYLERSEFLGAYVDDELIGFMKLVCVDGVAGVMQILAKEAHQDKRPANALIAKAVELCEIKKLSHLLYANYQYMQGPDSLTDFKRRNGFEELLVPRYYVPLSATGKLVISLRLERGLRAWVPRPVQASLRQIRAIILDHLPAN